jgi:hypothetical protein
MRNLNGEQKAEIADVLFIIAVAILIAYLVRIFI